MHTLGPWSLEQEMTSSGVKFSVYDENGSRLTQPNIDLRAARLIEAAPDLLRALKSLYAIALIDRDEDWAPLANAAAIIAKATGA